MTQQETEYGYEADPVQEAATADAQALRQMAELVEDPRYRAAIDQGAQRQGGAAYQAMRAKLKGDALREFDESAARGAYSSWDEVVNHFDRLRTASAPAPRATAAPRAADAPFKTLLEAQRAHAAHKISDAQMRQIRLSGLPSGRKRGDTFGGGIR